MPPSCQQNAILETSSSQHRWRQPRSSEVEPKMAILLLSWPSYSLCWLIWELLLTIVPSLFPILAPTCLTIQSKMQYSSQHNWRQPPRCLSPPFQAPQKCRKPKKTKRFSVCFLLSSHGAKVDQKCSQNLQKLPSSAQNGNLVAIMAHLRAIVPHLGRNLPPTLPQLRPSCARNFHQIAPCTWRSAPGAPKILPAFHLPRFSNPSELRFHRFWVPTDNLILRQ